MNGNPFRKGVRLGWSTFVPKAHGAVGGHPEHNVQSDGVVRRLADGREESMLSPRRRGESHASFLLRLPPAPDVPGAEHGELLCVWFNGPTEGDVNIWILLSRLPLGARKRGVRKEWSIPIKVSEMHRFSVQNPVLHWIPDDEPAGRGTLLLMHTAQPVRRGQAEGRVVARVSRDRGHSWSANPTPLLTRRGSFIRHGALPAQSEGGKGWLLPVYYTPRGMGNTEGQGVDLLRSEDEHGLRWREVPPPGAVVAPSAAAAEGAEDGGDEDGSDADADAGAGVTEGVTTEGSVSRLGSGLVQAAVVRLHSEVRPGPLRAFLRDRAAKSIHTCTSDDDGVTWTEPEAMTMPNNNKGIAAAVLSAAVGEGKATTDDASSYVLLVFNNIAGGKRFNPLSVAVSADGGATWPWVRDLEVAPRGSSAERVEKSYPSVAVDADGLGAHVSYTCSFPGAYGHRHAIRVVHVTIDWLLDPEAPESIGRFKGSGERPPFVRRAPPVSGDGGGEEEEDPLPAVGEVLADEDAAEEAAVTAEAEAVEAQAAAEEAAARAREAAERAARVEEERRTARERKAAARRQRAEDRANARLASDGWPQTEREQSDENRRVEVIDEADPSEVGE